jgi:6-phosphogluconolactonase
MKISILLFLMTGIFSNLSGQKVNQEKSFFLLVGTYTSDVKSDGIFVYEFNSLTGGFELKSSIAGEENPAFLGISRDGRFVYSVNEVKNGNISSFKFDESTGKLSFLNRVSSGGESPCFIEVDDDDKFVFTANYANGTLAAIPLNSDGTLKNDIQVIKHEGSSIDRSRQQGPHVHSTFLTPDKQFILVPDLGTDKVYTYSIKKGVKSQPLTPADPPYVSVKPGSGPRHLAFHPNSKYVYLIQELKGLITVFDYEGGKLTEKQTITMLAPDYKGRAGAADIHLSPDGKFLYGSNRGDANELAVYSVKKNGTLSNTGRQTTLGIMPRNFAIDPTGNFLLVANQISNEIVIFKRDKKTGKLTPLEERIKVSKPVCLKFVAMK